MAQEAEALAARAKQGDAQAFGDLYATVWRELYKFAYYYLGNPEDAEDAVQETAVEAYKGIGRLKEPAAFKGWIFAILTVCCKRRVGALIRRREQVQLEERPDLSDGRDQSESMSLSLELREALDRLTAEERAGVLLTVTEGYKSHEIAAMLHMTGGGVRSKLSRALKKMRKYINIEG